MAVFPRRKNGLTKFGIKSSNNNDLNDADFARSTIPGEISDRGEIGGSYNDSNGLQRGFVRFANGKFTPPIVPPFNVGDFTGADDVNDARTICGFFFEPDNARTHGYFFSQGAF